MSPFSHRRITGALLFFGELNLLVPGYPPGTEDGEDGQRFRLVLSRARDRHHSLYPLLSDVSQSAGQAKNVAAHDLACRVAVFMEGNAEDPDRTLERLRDQIRLLDFDTENLWAESLLNHYLAASAWARILSPDQLTLEFLGGGRQIHSLFSRGTRSLIPL